MDDDIGLKNKGDPLISSPSKKMKKAPVEEHKGDGRDTLAFLRRAEEETK